MIDLGDVVHLAFPSSATSVTLTITLPDGTTAAPAPAGPARGAFTCDYQPVQAGRHTYRWVATSPPDVSSGVFNVAEATVGAIVGLDETKKHLNMDLARTTNDDELMDVIGAATPVVEDVVGPVVVRTFSEVHVLRDANRYRLQSDTWNHGYHQPWFHNRTELVLGRKQALALVSVQPVLSGGVSYDPAVLDLDVPTGVVRRVDGWGFIGPLRVTYKAGFPIVPGNVLQATLEIVRHAWETQRGHASARPGFSDDDLAQTPSGFLIPRRALEWLRPHDRGPVMA